jgi:hypothetical protein
MSAISSVGGSSAAVTQALQAAAVAKKPAEPHAQATQASGGSDPDHDGDIHSGGLDIKG